jgi:hypothetical protein
METRMEWASLRTVAVFLLVVAIPGVGRAVDLFGVEVTYGGGTISQSASSLPDLVEALTKNQDAFAPLVGQDFTGSLTYYGIPGAVSVQVQGETQLTVTSSLTGLNRTFTGTDRDDLEQQLEDWLLKEGGKEVANLMKAAAKSSTAAIIDGNPSAATARMADRAFSTFGLYPATPAMRGSTKGSYLGLWADAKRSTADTPIGSVDSSQYGFNIPWWLDFSKRVSLIGNMSGQYMDAEGTAIYGGGMDLGLGIRLASRGEADQFGWQITPFAGLHGLGTYDGASGGLLDHFGIANRFEFMLNQDVQLIVASQFSYYDSLKLEIENVEIDPELNQQVVKNAIMLDTPVGSAKWLHVNGFAMDTRFLKDVAIDGYQTVGGGFSMRKGGTSLNASVSYDIADNYNSWNFGAGLGFEW